MKCSNSSFKNTSINISIGQITFQMMKIMSNTHKVIIDNEHLICFDHEKNMQIKKKTCGFHDHNK